MDSGTNDQYFETDRLIIRRFEEGDGAGIFELDSDPEVHRYLGNDPMTDVKESEEVVKKIMEQYSKYGIGRWAIIMKDGGDFAGWTGLKFETKPGYGGVPYYDLGFRLKKKYWGRGIATETALISLEYGFGTMHLEQISAAAQVENIGSNKVIRRSGLRFITTFPYEDITCNWYTISRAEWEERLNN